MSDSRFVHCECGATSPFVRIWDVDDIHRERMRELIRATIRTFEAKGFVVDRHRFAAIALAGWKRIPREGVHGPRRQTPIDDALEEATDAAVREPPTDQQVVTV